MNILLQWLLAIVIIAIISGIVMGFIMMLYWMIHVKKVIKNVPQNMGEIIKLEEAKQKEVTNGRENTRRERQRRVGIEEVERYNGQQRGEFLSGSDKIVPRINEKSENSNGRLREDKTESKPNNRFSKLSRI